MLNPEVSNRIIQDIIMQLKYHYKDAPKLGNVLRSLKNVGPAKSWGNLAQNAYAAAKPVSGAGKEVLQHIKTRNMFYNDNPKLATQAMGPEYIGGPAAAWASLKAGLGTTMSPLVSLGAPIAAGALGGLAIKNASNKANKEIDSIHSPERNQRHQELLKAIKRQGEKKRNNLSNINN